MRFGIMLAALVLAALARPARADSLKDFVEKLPPPAFSSEHSMEALEYCIGVDIGDWLTPITLRGERKVLLYGSPTSSFSNVIYILVAIQDDGQRRQISFHAHKAWNDKTEALIRSCL